MPDLTIQITGVESSMRSMTPSLPFKATITNSPADENIQCVVLNAQIQIQSPQRSYSATEKENLFELFGPPESWGETLRNRVWAHTTATTGAFRGNIEVVLPVPCSLDLNIASAKYFNGLEGGEVPLLFLFSGSIFYSAQDGRLQVTPISWNTECVWRMPAAAWRGVMEQYYRNSAWLSLRRDVFDRLCAYKRRNHFIAWEQAIGQLLDHPAAQTAEPREMTV